MASVSSLVLPTSSPSASPPIPLDPNHPTPAECKALKPPLSSLPRSITLGLVIGISSPSDPDTLIRDCCFPNPVQSLPPCWIWCELPTNGPLVSQPQGALGTSHGGISINGKDIGRNFSNCLVNGGTDSVERGLTLRAQGVTSSVGNGVQAGNTVLVDGPVGSGVTISVNGSARSSSGGEKRALGTSGLGVFALVLSGLLGF